MIKHTKIYESLTSDEFIEKLENIYYKYFPKSKIEISKHTLLGETSIYIDCYLAKDKSEVAHSIMDNDMLHVSLEVNEPDKDKHELTAIQSYMLIEPEESYLFFGSCRLPFRMITGDYDKILKYLEKYFARAKQKIKELSKDGKIHKNFKDIVSKKVLNESKFSNRSRICESEKLYYCVNRYEKDRIKERDLLDAIEKHKACDNEPSATTVEEGNVKSLNRLINGFKKQYSSEYEKGTLYEYVLDIFTLDEDDDPDECIETYLSDFKVEDLPESCIFELMCSDRKIKNVYDRYDLETDLNIEYPDGLPQKIEDEFDDNPDANYFYYDGRIIQAIDDVYDYYINHAGSPLIKL